VRVWQAEGAAAVRDRIWDRAIEAGRRASIRLRGLGGLGGGHDGREAWPTVSVLNVIGVPIAATFGGVPLQLRTRLLRESAERRVALLSRERDGNFRLECWNASDRLPRVAIFAGGEWNGDPLAEDVGWLNAVRSCCELVKPRAIHVENAAGLSMVSLAQLPLHLPLALSVHDFALFCRRPHLWDARGGCGFCHYSTDAARCGACLSAAAAADRFAIDQTTHRRLGAELLRAAALVIVPSRFMRDQLETLFAWQSDRNGHVIAPGIELPPAANATRSARHADQVAFLGGGQEHKGGGRFLSLATALAARGVAVTVYGGYGHDNLRALRGVRDVRVRGYFRAGSLPALLARQGAAVALALSGVPESFSLALSEAWAAGVPVVAPALGAFSERLQDAGDAGGQLVSADPSDAEVLDAIDRVRARASGGMAAPRPTPTPPTAAQAAAQHLAIYRERGLITSS
jgi:glycosyltransferase involved in cell wall biosynthesis